MSPMSQFSKEPLTPGLKKSLLSEESRFYVYTVRDYAESAEGGVVVKSVQNSDLEDTVIVPRGKWLTGPLCGNAIWRSPESGCRSRQNQASDVFSFGFVMIYVMVNEMVFRVNDDELNSADSWRYVLRRHISYFADEDGLGEFLEHIGEENPFYERLKDLANTFGPENPRQPFERWGLCRARS
ncbi:hypothetical protein CNMCM5623_007801 [Aspergillus felis]|uniref:Protein kinase domain-containing protein n=1 Tax=Aspergillus felis TaxID=1287682 RepID=A0A8H6PWN7_9EURO|nr:hypothetical protein CNMCM5623_007801 [Aspergillus felis]